MRADHNVTTLVNNAHNIYIILYRMDLYKRK